ncbi:MAG: tRNA (N6-threonylcarbamoyladenosine(37)-N6)-methyltransferase TrmO [Candidatus Contendobacter sp.]|nr:tRNA (N6-threonylcarbamoyladenosine(37)-N6)-methyltransferase TrmO [Candidatus Contendobacter sp.]
MFQFAPIGFIHSCFRQKFGIPRQPGLVPAARATLELLPPYAQPEAVRGLEGFSHLWLLFVFHGVPVGRWQPTVRPPRLGGNQRLGVFATRSTFRPNPIGLSAVALERIERRQGQIVLHLAGVDMLDETPVLDIKPYLPYADCIVDAIGGFAGAAPALLPAVEFSPTAAAFCAAWPNGDLRELIAQILRQDPRPAYQQAACALRQYGMTLYDCDVQWEVRDGVAYVLEIRPCLESANPI